MNQEQKKFLINVLNSISIKAGDPTAAQTIEMVQSILVELNKE